jgi:hypothetical protein
VFVSGLSCFSEQGIVVEVTKVCREVDKSENKESTEK